MSSRLRPLTAGKTTHSVQVQASARTSSGGYRFAVRTVRKGTTLDVFVTLEPPSGMAATVMSNVSLNKVIDVPAGVKVVNVYDWRTGNLFESYTLLSPPAA